MHRHRKPSSSRVFPGSSQRPQKEDDMMDTTPLRDAYRALLDAAATVADSGDTSPVLPAGEWNAELVTGLAEVELPGHTKQLLGLLPSGTGAEAATHRRQCSPDR